MGKEEKLRSASYKHSQKSVQRPDVGVEGRHNEALSPLDAMAGRFFSAVKWMHDDIFDKKTLSKRRRIRSLQGDHQAVAHTLAQDGDGLALAELAEECAATDLDQVAARTGT